MTHQSCNYSRALLRGLLPVLVMAALYRCSNLQLAGSISETTNGNALGKVVHQNGTPALQTQVRLFTAEGDPVLSSASVLVDTTDSLGNYAFTHIDSGYYTVQAVHICNRTRAIITGIHVAGDTVDVPVAVLRMPGAIKVMFPDSVDALYGYVYVPGTDIFTFLYNSTAFVMLDSVPVGTIPAVYYSTTNSPVQRVIRYNIPVASGATATVSNPAWKYAQQLILNTSSSGANVSGTVINFPVLVRLTGSNFNFNEANAHGNDLRFTKEDTVSLSYEIERWDSAAGRAEVWVKMDTVYGSNGSQTIVMYWGNAQASDVSNPAAVFDTSEGFQGVWHLAEAGNTTALDATGNHYDGTPYGMSAASAVSGAIGTSQAFNGASSHIHMQGTANSRLNFPESGTFALSAWVNAESADAQPHVIASKGHEDYYLKLMSNATTRNKWEFVEYHDKKGWDITEDSQQAEAKTWKYLVGVRSGAKQYLYLDGVLIDSTIRAAVCDSVRVETDDFSIGRYPRSVTFVTFEGMCAFSGMIDEVRISSSVPTADWIKLCFINQKANSTLVVFK